MPLKYSQVRGRPVGLYLALLDVGTITEPSDLTVTVATGGAAADATSITVDALGAAIPKNSIIEFTPTTGDPFLVVVTEDAAAAATAISVEAYDGVEGDGIPTALDAADTGVWDRLYTVAGTENAPFSNNPQTNDLTHVAYGSGSGVRASDPEVQSVAPQIQRSGLFIAEGQLTKDILQYADTNRNWWAKQVLPDANGDPWRSREGLARVTDLQNDGPADGLLRLSFNIRFRNVPTQVDLSS